LYRVDQVPVVLLYGPIPAYRTLAEGETAAGGDVAQLNHDLVALGDVAKSEVDAAWDEFHWATRVGVEKLQAHLGVEQTGELPLGDVVFLPNAARVTTLQAGLGAPATGPVLSTSSRVRTVTVALEPDLTSQAKAGDRVAITLPNGETTAGRVTSVGKVATVPSNNPGGPDSGPTIPVHIRLIHPRAAGSLDQALVTVAIIDQTVHDVLAVPVTALLARSGGGYAVEVVAGDGTHHLVQVTPGLFDDVAGMVQVSGPQLRAGQRIVVPGE
jgi:multidrug efflux pump subunit AcrA (membrane-fusion protein)